MRSFRGQPLRGHFDLIFKIWWPDGAERNPSKSSSKHMCFIDQSGRDLVFYLDETRISVTKYCILSIRMEGKTGAKFLRSRN